MDLTGAILLSGLSLGIGFLVWMLVFTLRKGSAPEDPSRERVLSDSEQSVRVWREGKERQLVIEMGGVSHYRGSELHDDQNQIIADLIKELTAWMGPPPAAPAPVALPQSEPKEIKLEPTKAAEIEAKPPSTSLNPFKIFGRAIQPREKTESDRSDLSIVGQIDEILQAKLAGTHLEERGIRLVEGPDQSMVIQIGLQSYSEIDQVPDEQVVNLIRLSVAEWEQSLGD
jgi:hypothetical protein